jgi:hypothetical protein
MNDFLSLRNSNRPKTQAEVDAMMANEPDRLPWGGAGSMAGHARRASKQYRPTDARARLTANERKQFAAEHAEVSRSPEMEKAAFELLDQRFVSDAVLETFAKAVRKNQPFEDVWSKKLSAAGECHLLDGFERDGDPTGAPEAQIIAAWRNFAQSEVFAAYAFNSAVKDARYKAAEKVMNILFNWQQVNLVNMTLPASWAKSFGLLQNLNVFPAPVPTSAQVQAIERNKAADDGNPVVINDATGMPVTYQFKDGRVVRYSKQMLDQLNSESYAKVLGIRKSQGELKETEDERRARKAHEYRNTVVAGGFTQYELDQMPSEQYRKVMQLSRAPMAMKPFAGL